MSVRLVSDTCVTLCGIADITAADEIRLTDAERDLVSRATALHRANELRAGRFAAAQAFETFAVVSRPSVLSDADGRPVLIPPSRWFISLAHDGGTAGAALSSRPVGLDIVALSRAAQVERAVRSRINAHGALPLVGDPLRFSETMLLWSAWEAIGKKSGGGVLSGPMLMPVGPVIEDGEFLRARTHSDQICWWSEEELLLCLATPAQP